MPFTHDVDSDVNDDDNDDVSTFSTDRGCPAATRFERALQANIEFTAWSGCKDSSIKSTTCRKGLENSSKSEFRIHF